MKHSLVSNLLSARGCFIQGYTKHKLGCSSKKAVKMSFTYSGDPSESEVDRLRFLLADTDSAKAIFSDEELNFLIDEYGDNDDVLKYQAFSQAATRFALQIKRSLGPQSEDPTSRLDYFKSKADELKKKLSAKGISLPRYQSKKQFWRGMMDNPPCSSEPKYVR